MNDCLGFGEDGGDKGALEIQGFFFQGDENVLKLTVAVVATYLRTCQNPLNCNFIFNMYFSNIALRFYLL